MASRPPHRRCLAFALACSLAAAACHGPVGPFAGGRLTGRVVDVPAGDWSFTDDFALMQIEVRPSDPYSVHIHFYRVGDRLYIEAGERKWSRWRTFLHEDPHVRARFGESVYELVATRVLEPAEIATVLPLYFSRDGADPPATCAGGWDSKGCAPVGLAFFRLDPGPEQVTPEAR